MKRRAGYGSRVERGAEVSPFDTGARRDLARAYANDLARPGESRIFSSGFPYGKDEYLSYAGSSWAVMAMLSSLPDRRQARCGFE